MTLIYSSLIHSHTWLFMYSVSYLWCHYGRDETFPVRRCFGRGGRVRCGRQGAAGRQAGREARGARHLPILMRSRIPLSLVSLELYIIVEWELHRWISFVQPIKSSFPRYQTYYRHLSRLRGRLRRISPFFLLFYHFYICDYRWHCNIKFNETLGSLGM